MRELGEECPIGIAAGESERTYFGFRDMASVGVKQLQPCIMKLPAVLDWMKVRDLTIERGLELTSGGFSPLTAAFIATASEDSLTEYLVPLLSIFIETLGKKPELRDGCFYLSSDPGLPIQPEWEKLENGGLVTEVIHFHKKNM
jgi:L-alanine-DL-glutamate epimerase-like enolase superfamily enzyme